MTAVQCTLLGHVGETTDSSSCSSAKEMSEYGDTVYCWEVRWLSKG